MEVEVDFSPPFLPSFHSQSDYGNSEEGFDDEEDREVKE